jgi:RimJ/RimL family protein N-acetyltransferase
MLFLFPPDWPLAAAEAFMDSVRRTGALPFRLAIEREGVWRGWIGVLAGEVPEVVYALEPGAAGKDHATEALQALLALVFDRSAVAALSAGVFTDNPASARMLEKAGFLRAVLKDAASAARDAPAPCWLFRHDRA